MQIGEQMSKVVDLMDGTLYLLNGDIYEDYEHFLMNKPLDSGRLLYIMLRRVIPEGTEFEVWFDHFSNEVTAQIRGRDFVSETTFRDDQMPRHEKLDRIGRIVEGARSSLS